MAFKAIPDPDTGRAVRGVRYDPDTDRLEIRVRNRLQRLDLGALRTDERVDDRRRAGIESKR